MGLFSSSGKATRPIVLESQGGGRVEIGTPDGRGRCTVTVTDRAGRVELRQTVTHDPHQYAQDIAREYGADGGTLRRQP